MIARLTLLMIAFALVNPTTASANVSGDWGRYASVAGHFTAPLPVAYVHSEGCPTEAYGSERPPCAYPTTGHVWIPADDLSRFTLAHELGHVWDGQNLTEADRNRLRVLTSAPAGPWWSERGPSEWFADYYADCATDPTLRSHTSNESFTRPTRGRLRRVCAAIERVAARPIGS